MYSPKSEHDHGTSDQRRTLLPSPVSQGTHGNQPIYSVVPTASGKCNRDWVIARIEDVFDQQVNGIIANSGHLEIIVKSRQSNAGNQTPDFRHFKFPGTSERDAWKYTVIIRILELIHEALVTETIITKRDIYYRDPALFAEQVVVDRFVDDLAFTFGVPRMALNVIAAAKGLIAGNFELKRDDGTVIIGRHNREGTLIPHLKNSESFEIENIKWVLLVEKEATFRSLTSSVFWNSLSSHGLLVTAKGYPDVATRLLLRSLSLREKDTITKRIPIYALVDYDPDGIEILSTYKHGSAALIYDKAELEVPGLQWLGVRSEVVGQQDNLHQSQGLLGLSARDRRKARHMLTRDTFAEGGEDPAWRRELQVMLYLNVKAEIQLVEAQTDGLPGWLKERGVE